MNIREEAKNLIQSLNLDVRKEQIDMIHLIYNTLNNNTNAHNNSIIEAPTGTGKTLAVIIPSILIESAQPRPIVISTGTKNLQDQYVKTLKELQAFRNFKFKVAKGKGNFLCASKLQKYNETETPIYTVTHKQEDNFHIPPEIWKKINCDETCTKKACTNYEICKFQKERQELKDAKVIISNHHLSIIDLILKSKSEGYAKILPQDIQGYIFDEGHHIEDVAQKCLGNEITNMTIPHNLNILQKTTLKVYQKEFENCIIANETLFNTIYNKMTTQSQRLPLDQEIIKHTIKLNKAVQTYINTINTIKDMYNQEDQKRIETTIDILKEHFQSLTIFLNYLKPEEYVHWAEKRDQKYIKVSLNTSPIDIGPILKDILFNPHNVSIISATIGDFEYLERKFSTPFNKIKLDYIFDYQKNALLYVPKIQNPKTREYKEKIIPEIKNLLNITKGNALILFTSYGNMNFVFQELSDIPYPMKKQEKGVTSSNLTEWIKETPHGVILGTNSLWEGIDIPGDDLKLVIIDKLPFDVPDNPVTKAIYEAHDNKGGNSFFDISLPLAIRRLKQGFGRLIRSQDDRGAVVILDSRIITTRYGKQFLNSLPPVPKCREIRNVQDFFPA